MPVLKKRRSAFTLLELMVVIAIIAVMVIEITPSLNTAIARARSIVCGANLRQIGIALNSYVADNNNTYPVIESGNGTNYYYPGMDSGSSSNTLGLVLSPYGIGTNSASLRCPEDRFVNSPPMYTSMNYYDSSYQWLPVLDDETNTDPVVFGRRGLVHQVKLSHLRLVMDWSNIHFGHCNGLYADGHVKMYQR